jgi:ABC-type multidrug transport system fused ATPase/permease subunit
MELALIFAIIGLGSYAIIYTEDSGVISSTFGAFIVVSTRIFPSLLRLQGTQVSLRLYRETAESALRLVESLEEATSRIDIAVTKDFQSKKSMGENFIEIKGLDYFHEENSFPTLKGIDLVIKRGERLIITGPSGSGKTTICDLMLGLIQPTSGKVLIEDMLPQDWLQKSESAASYLPQDTKLITGTILENILLGASESQYSQDKISEVVKVSQLGKFIGELPLGLNTQVGENGVRLSGGQKQRLGIARALLNSPSLLIMDEATSALDTKMEHDFFDLFNELPKSITIILIAHRFSSMLTSKRIV